MKILAADAGQAARYGSSDVSLDPEMAVTVANEAVEWAETRVGPGY
jgi:hypothetical protein